MSQIDNTRFHFPNPTESAEAYDGLYHLLDSKPGDFVTIRYQSNPETSKQYPLFYIQIVKKEEDSNVVEALSCAGHQDWQENTRIRIHGMTGNPDSPLMTKEPCIANDHCLVFDSFDPELKEKHLAGIEKLKTHFGEMTIHEYLQHLEKIHYLEPQDEEMKQKVIDSWCGWTECCSPNIESFVVEKSDKD